MKIFYRLLYYSRDVKKRLVLFVMVSFLGVVFGAFNIILVIPMLNVLFGQTTDAAPDPLPDFSFSSDYPIAVFNHYFQTVIYHHGKVDALLFVCALIMASVLLANFFRFSEYVIAVKLRVDMVRNLRLSLFKNVSRLHIGFFHSQKKGGILSRFSNDVNEVEGTLIESIKAILREPITMVVYFVILFSFSVKLTLFTLVFLPMTGIVVSEVIKRLKKRAIEHQESLGRLFNIIEETLGGIRIVKAFNAERFVFGKMKEESDHFRKVSKSMLYKNEMASPVSEVLGALIVVTIVFFGGTMVLGDDSALTPNEFLGFLALFATLIQPVKNLSGGLSKAQKVKVSAKRIFDLMETSRGIRNRPGAVQLKRFEKEIVFRNVSFAYENATPVLKNIDLLIEKGKTVALVGASGSGKSTLTDLLARFYDVTEGDIFVDGQPISSYTVESLREQIGMVSQESILFHDTVFNNIAFGLPYANEEQVIQAAKVANAHSFIMQMEKGYQTLIGERGAKISGGQRQRLSIARAVLKNPSILILDEATSALDAESEKWVQEALFNLMENRTSIVIAHRLSTIKQADKIVVLQDGEIVESGAHSELEAQDGVYKHLLNLQGIAT